MKRRDFLKTIGIGLAYACAPIVFIKEKAAGWTRITSGNFSITINGNPVDVGSLDFTGLDRLNKNESFSDMMDVATSKRKLTWKSGEFGHFEFNKIK